MKSLFNYIISTESRYNNKINVDQKELILNTQISERDYMFVNRIGVVVNEPAYGVTSKTPKKGDTVIFAAFGGGFTWGSIYLKWAYDKK